MHPSGTIELELGELRLPLHVQRTSSVRSEHTGRALTELHGVITAGDRVHQQLKSILQEEGSRRGRPVDDQDGPTTRWSVSWNAYSESAGEHTYSLILREDEELTLEALIVDGVELHPYEYRESFNGDELTIQAKLVGSKAEVFRLRTLLRTRNTFPVVRRGIQEEPRRMRFGVAEWSEHEGQIKYRVVFVEEGADRAEHPELVRIAEANSRSAMPFYMNFVERLAELLEARGILPAEEIEAARDAAREEFGHARREFWQVADVDLL